MKTFRAAAQRVVEQETAQPDTRVHQFAPARPHRRAIAHERDAWEVQLGAIASLAGYDAIACFSPGLTAPRSANVADLRALATVIASAREQAARTGLPLHMRAAIELLDGRTGTSLLVAPLCGIDGVEGTFVALRAAAPFDARDGTRAQRVADMLALDILRSTELRQSAAARRDAIALFELSRLALSGDDAQHVVELLAQVAGYDVVQVWESRAGGTLRLIAAQPSDPEGLEIAHPREQPVLRRALDGATLSVRDDSLRYLVRRTAHELVVAPLRRPDGIGGVLVLGRWREAIADDAPFATAAAELVAHVTGRAAAASAQVLKDLAANEREL